MSKTDFIDAQRSADVRTPRYPLAPIKAAALKKLAPAPAERRRHRQASR